jgi:hypothetical protein
MIMGIYIRGGTRQNRGSDLSYQKKTLYIAYYTIKIIN